MASAQPLNQQLIDEFVGVAHGDFDRVKAMLAQQPDLLNAQSSFDETALGAAAQMGRKDMAEFLLAQGAPLDICTAAMLGLKAQVEKFLNDDPNQAQATGAHGIPVLYFPVIAGHREIAEMLLARGADVNAGQGGVPPIHGAVLFGQVEMLDWLIEHSANVNALDYEGKTPLRVASEKGNTVAAELLRQRGGKDQQVDASLHHR
jgi:uncharacterized protein